MSLYSKVSWKDGMFLLPQHFQQSERNLESLLSLRFAESPLLRFGVVELRIDADALAGGRLRIAGCRALFPDGMAVDIPEGDPEPEPRAFELPSEGVLGVYLTVPARRGGVPLVAGEPEGDVPGLAEARERRLQRASVRFVEEPAIVPDDQDPLSRQEILVAVKNLRLHFSGESLEGLHSLKLAEVRRGPGGTPVLSDTYVPPCPFLAAAPALLRRSRDLVGAVAARAEELATTHRHRSNVLELTPAEVPEFWFLSQLNLQLPVLRQLLDLPGTHPAELYAELLRLAGGLSTFTFQPPLELPAYRHDAIGDCFAALDARVRKLLTWKMGQKWRSFPFKLEGRTFITKIDDAALLAEGEFYLLSALTPPADASGRGPAGALTGQAMEKEMERLLDPLPNRTIMGELGRIGDFADRSYQAVHINKVPRPPSPIPVRNDARYFRVEIDSPHWTEIRKTGQVATYLPRDYDKIYLELIAVTPGGR